MPVANSTKPASMASKVPQWSRWSGSTFVTIPATAGSLRNDPSDSSASTMNRSPAPWWALAPESLSSLPIANDGSAPQCWAAIVSIEVVVVLPCVPATATPRKPAITAARASARDTTGIPRAWAPTTSGLVGLDRRRDDHDVRALDVGRRRGRPARRCPARAAPPAAGTPSRRCPRPRRPGPPGSGRSRTCRHRRCPRCARARSGPPSPLTSPCRPAGRPAASITMSASLSSASRMPCAAARAPIRSIRSGSATSARTSASSVSPSRSSSATSSPPPALTTGRALSRCSPLPIGKGT